MKLLLAIVAFFIAGTAGAQSFFGHLAKPIYANQKTEPSFGRQRFVVADSSLPIPTGDSVFSGPRLTGVQISYGITDGYTASNIITSTGIGWTHGTYKTAKQRWNIDWSAGLLAGAAGHIAPNNLQEVGVFGAYVGLFNNFVVISAFYALKRPDGVKTNWIGAVGGNAYLVPTN